MTKLEKLMFLIGVKDEASSKMGKLQKNLVEMKTAGAGAVAGFVGFKAATVGLHNAVSPAIDLNAALGEVASLGVGDSGLKSLQIAAFDVTQSFGGSASDIVRSAYDIQSAIAGLDGSELGAFTKSSAILARATKSNAGTITNYMGTMYGIYETDAKKMGRAEWVEQLTGRTAYAVQAFKTTGDKMSSAFTALGAKAQSAGIDAAEQMAILGTLQATMGGSEAGTKYKAFLAGVGNAQKDLGLKFTDSKGNMLGIVDILDKIRGKFGDEISVKEADMLKKAFGSDEAVAMINLLLPKTKALKGSIQDISKIKGMGAAEDMANKQTDAWMRLSSSFTNVQSNLMQKVLPPIEAVVDAIAGGMVWINKMIDAYPNLSAAIGWAVLAAMSFVGVVSLYSMVKNAIIIIKLLTAAKVINGNASVASAAKIGIFRAATLALGHVLLAPIRLLGMFTIGLVKMGIAAMANPLTWIILAVLALIAGVVLLIVYWDEIVAYLQNTTWGRVLISIVDKVCGAFNWLKSLVSEIFNWIGGKLEWVMEKISSVGDFFGFEGNSFAFSDPTGTLQMMEYADIPAPSLNAPRPTTINSLEAAKTLQVPAGGLGNSINNRNQTQSQNTNIGEQHIHIQEADGELVEKLKLKGK